MANLDATLLTQQDIQSDLPFRNRSADVPTVPSPVSDKPFTYRSGSVSYLGGGGVAVTYWYKIRVRDDGVGPPPVYRTWASTDAASGVPGAPPVGAWVDRTILDRWAL